MTESGWYRFSAGVDNITLAGDTGDFFALIGGATPWRLLELRVWQRGSATLVMDTLRIHRGTGGGSGTPETGYKYRTAGPAATVSAISLPTVDVGTDDYVRRMGWNLLQEQVWMPTPELIIPCKANDDIGITYASGTAHTGVGVQVDWEEYIGS